MGRTACTEPQCLYKGDLYLFIIKVVIRSGFYMNVEAFYCIEVTAFLLVMWYLYYTINISKGMHMFI